MAFLRNFSGPWPIFGVKFTWIALQANKKKEKGNVEYKLKLNYIQSCRALVAYTCCWIQAANIFMKQIFSF